jgi:hypothetical protein
MTRTVARAADLSKHPTRTDAGGFEWFDAIARELKDLFPRKTAVETAFRAGCDVSNAEPWLSGKTAPNGEALARLLCSDVGDRLHVALIENVHTRWAEQRRAELEAAQLRQQQAEIARRLAQLESDKGRGR